MKKSLLLTAGALLMATSAFAQKDVTPSGYDFSKYEDGELFKLTPCNSTGWSVTADFFKNSGEQAIADYGHLTTLVQRGTAFNDQAGIDAISKNVFIKDMGAAGKCLIVSEPYCPIVPDGTPAGFHGQPQLNFFMDPALFDNLDDPHYVRVKMVFSAYQRGCHFIGKNPDNVKTAGAWIANTYATCDRGWVVPEADHENPNGSFWGIDFARWVGETGKSADIPENPEVMFVTNLTPDDDPLDPTHNASAANHDKPIYVINPDRYIVVEWDVPYNYSFGTVSVQFNLANANSNAVIKEIKFYDLGTDETAATLLGKRKISYIYASENAGEEPGDETDLTKGKYFIRNVETGYYLSQGHSWGTMAVLKEPAARTYEFEAVDGGYKIKSVMGYVKGGGELFVDGGNANDGGVFGIEKAGDHYYIKQGDKYVSLGDASNYQSTDTWNYDFWLMENTNYLIKTDVATPENGSLWDIVSYDDMLASLADATEENPVDASFFVKAQNVEQNDPEVKTAWIYTKNGQKADLILGGRDWSDKVDWHAHAPYIWCINEGDDAVAGEDILAQDIEGMPAGTYEAIYRIVNQSNTPLVVKFNDKEAKAYEKEGNDLWYTDAMEHLHKNEMKARFTVGEDGKLSVKFIKTIDPAQQNRFAFKSLALKYLGTEVAAAEEDGLTAETAWQLYTADDVEAMKDKVSAEHATYFKLMADIDMTGVNHIPAVGYSNGDFGKTIYFDGNNHVISNLTSHSTKIEGTDNYDFYYASLFGVFQGEVKNLGLVNVDLKSTLGVAGIGAYAGYGTTPAVIDNCYVTGDIEAISGYAGGIMGTCSAQATITNSYAQVNVKSANFAGGLVGRGANVALKNCYVAGTVAGTADGALVNLVATTKATPAGTLTMENVVAVNTGADTDTNYGTSATGTVTKDINVVKTWDAFNEGKLFNGLPALNWQENAEAGIDEVAADDVNAPVEYYNLQGIRVENPANGLYIKKQGNKATKVFIR